MIIYILYYTINTYKKQHASKSPDSHLIVYENPVTGGKEVLPIG